MGTMCEVIIKYEDDTDAKLTEYKRLKVQLNNLLCTTQYCGICLSTDKLSYSLRDPVDIGHWEGKTMVTLQSILQMLFGDMHSFASNRICEDCRVSAISAYLFVYNTKRTSDIIEDYVHQMDAGIDELYKEIGESNLDKFEKALIILQGPTIIKEIPLSDETEVTDQTEPTKVKIPQKRFLLCVECKKLDCKHREFLVSFAAQRMAGKKKIFCPQCKYACWFKVQLIGHANRIHLNNYSFVCEYCAKPLHSNHDYYIHVKKFHQKQIFCELCDKPFLNKQNYEIHKEACSLKKPKKYRCKECPSIFISEAKFKIHKQIHSVNTFACNLCNKVVSSEAFLKQHHKAIHSVKTVKKVRQYHCTICHMKFSTVREKKDHMKSHSLDEKHQCIECNKTFHAKSQYRNHMISAEHRRKTNCKEPLTHKCPDCEFSTPSATTLEGHVNRHHLMIAPYSCDQCGWKFTSKHRITQHMQTHANKKLQCQICGNLLGSNIAMVKHVRLHTGERPYPCDLCPGKFISASHRKAHMLRVHGERNVKCPLCDSMYHSIGNMRLHFRKTHWKLKDEKFDIRKVKGLSPEDYELFRDKRQLPFCKPEY